MQPTTLICLVPCVCLLLLRRLSWQLRWAGLCPGAGKFALRHHPSWQSWTMGHSWEGVESPDLKWAVTSLSMAKSMTHCYTQFRKALSEEKHVTLHLLKQGHSRVYSCCQPSKLFLFTNNSALCMKTVSRARQRSPDGTIFHRNVWFYQFTSEEEFCFTVYRTSVKHMKHM